VQEELEMEVLVAAAAVIHKILLLFLLQLLIIP
jgi:hypothetical protein